MGSCNNKSKWSNKLSRKSAVLKGRKTSIKGTVGEYKAIAELTKAGYYVAKSCDPACPFDIVIVSKDGKIELLDIKTNSYRKRAKGKILKNKPKGSYKIHRTTTKEQKKLGIKLLMVDYEESEIVH